MRFQHDDGGRAAAGFKGQTGDCVTRAVAIATGEPYRRVYDAINRSIVSRGHPTLGVNRQSARTGVPREVYDLMLRRMGWEWVPTMRIGSGCTVHLRADELPSGRLIVRLSHHITAVINGVIHDTYDTSRGGQRCVYGYYYQPGA